MSKENRSLEFSLKTIDETRNYFIKEVEQNKLMSNTHKKVYMTVNYFGHFLTLGSLLKVLFLFLYLPLL